MSAGPTRSNSPKQGKPTPTSEMTGSYDPENPPLTPEECDAMRRVAPAALIREKLGMSRAAFASAYGIPLDKLAAWERRTAEPTETELVYLRLIERNPEGAKMVSA